MLPCGNLDMAGFFLYGARLSMCHNTIAFVIVGGVASSRNKPVTTTLPSLKINDSDNQSASVKIILTATLIFLRPQNHFSP